MACNHILVAVENVREIDFSRFGEKEVRITLLLGAQQKKLDVELVMRLTASRIPVDIEHLESSGKNALDFVLCYYVGRISATDPTAYIHIVSADKGFDPLVEHLRGKGMKARRHDSFATLTLSYAGPAKPPPPEDPFEHAVLHLRKSTQNRPKRRKTLLTHLDNLFGKKRDATQLESLIAQLVARGQIAIDDKNVVSYVFAKSA